MITYLELTGWRILCEYLNGVKYKFATLDEIKKDCKLVLPSLYAPRNREHRSRLYDNYLIQFITWQNHPYARFTRSRRAYRHYSDIYGWRLTKDWEYKIDYLEKIVLFGIEPEFKPWEQDLRKRLSERHQREEKLKFRIYLERLPVAERIQECHKLSICYRCFNPILLMMVDCINCGCVQPSFTTSETPL